jgi:pantoate--beta-alanine ligase
MHEISRSLKKEGKSIGFVPTMGYLHKGHISLIHESKKITNVTVVSIFVNPIQFAPNEDLSKYPKDFQKDKKFLIENEVDYLFFPSSKEIYPNEFQTYVEVSELTKILEGEFRPTHFKGVTTVVAILFNSIYADFAFFGQKDAQQAAIIKRMTKDLKFDIKIIICPIVREPDGLAMSSRNFYLSAKERNDALVLHDTLISVEKMIMNSKKELKNIFPEFVQKIKLCKNCRLDYLSAVESESFGIVDKIEKGKSYYILIACYIGKTRLIDNILISV